MDLLSRTSSILLTSLFCLSSFLPAAAGELKRIVILETMPARTVLEHTRLFVSAMEKRGFRAGERMEVTILEAHGDREKARGLLRKELAAGPPDLIVANATLAAEAAIEVAGRNGPPILFITVTDPVGSGIVGKVGEKTGDSVTGIVQSVPHAIMIDALQRTAAPGSRRPIRVGIVHTSYVSGRADAALLEKAGGARGGIVFHTREIPYRSIHDESEALMADARTALAELRGTVDFFWIVKGPLGNVNGIVDVIEEEGGAPVFMANSRYNVTRGALMYMAPSPEGVAEEAALIAEELLKGTSPGSIPLRWPRRYEVAVNVTTAIAHGLVIPSDLLELAGEHVYR